MLFRVIAAERAAGKASSLVRSFHVGKVLCEETKLATDTSAAINFKVEGYDYPQLESYQKVLNATASYLGATVSDGHAFPPSNFLVQKYKTRSTATQSEYNINVHSRTIQVLNSNALSYATLLRAAQVSLPEGVTLKVFKATEEYDELRYVPDQELISLKKLLENAQSTKDNRKK